MRFEPRLDPPSRRSPLRRRIGWMALYWLGSVAALGIVAMILRAWLSA